MSYRGFPIYTETKDLCKQTECPVNKGPVKVDLEQPFPIITPPVRPAASQCKYSGLCMPCPGLLKVSASNLCLAPC